MHTHDSVCAVRAMLVNIVCMPMMGSVRSVYIAGVAMMSIMLTVCIPMMGVACFVYIVGVAMMSTGDIVCIPMIVSAQSWRR